MPELIPEGFSWSASRASQLENCPRAYFFQYYLAVGRAIDADDRRRREAQRLKQLKTVPMWIGSHVHDAIEGMLKTASRGHAAHAADAADRMLEAMRKDYRDSLSNAASRGDPRRHVRFHEHEYGVSVSPEKWKLSVEEAVEMVRAFARLGFIDTVRELGPKDLLALEDLQQWEFDGIPIWVRIDLAFRDPSGTIHILDWKTGRSIRGENPLQLMGYAAYAEKQWAARANDLAVREVYLRLDKPERWCEIDDAALDGARGQIRASVEQMIDALPDPGQNLAIEERFEALPERQKCSRCFFRAICPAGG